MQVYTYTYEANGCSPEGSYPEVYRTPPEVGYEYDEVKAHTVPDGIESVWAVIQRTARCCGADAVIAHVYGGEDAERRAREEARLYSQTHKTPLTDSEWEYMEEGSMERPDAAWAQNLPILEAQDR